MRAYLGRRLEIWRARKRKYDDHVSLLGWRGRVHGVMVEVKRETSKHRSHPTPLVGCEPLSRHHHPIFVDPDA